MKKTSIMAVFYIGILGCGGTEYIDSYPDSASKPSVVVQGTVSGNKQPVESELPPCGGCIEAYEQCIDVYGDTDAQCKRKRQQCLNHCSSGGGGGPGPFTDICEVQPLFCATP